MSSDYRDYHSPEKVNARRRARYIREHAPMLHAALIGMQDGGQPLYPACGAAPLAVAAAGALFDALPPDPDAEDGSGAPAELLPVEPEATARAAQPTCTCSGKQPCSAECRRRVPERRQSAGPDEATHAGRVRQQRAARFAALADCQQTCDPGVIERYHAHLASSGLQDCGACGARLDVAVHAEPAVLQ